MVRNYIYCPHCGRRINKEILDREICGYRSPKFKLECILEKDHDGAHEHFPYNWGYNVQSKYYNENG